MRNVVNKVSEIPQDREERKESIKRSKVIYEGLRKDIITGALQPGESLVESQLAKQFNCSQAPIREACISLSNEGFLNATPYKGFTVSEITMKEIKDLYEVRLLVECAAAEMAARNAPPELIEEMELNMKIQRAGIDPENLWGFLNAEVSFHLAIAKASRNELLQRFVSLAWGRFQQFYFKTLPLRESKSDPDTVDEHSTIVAAIRAQDPERAKKLMFEHILLGRETALKVYFGF